MSKTLPSIDELKENSGAIFYDFDGVLTDNRVQNQTNARNGAPPPYYE